MPRRKKNSAILPLNHQQVAPSNAEVLPPDRADQSPSSLATELNAAATMCNPVQNGNSEPPLKRLKFQDEPITVLVGTEKAAFTVHKQVISEVSGLFEKALGGKFKEAAKNQVVLPDIDPTIFEKFLQWLYSSSLSISELMQSEPPKKPGFSWSLVTKLYTLGQYLQCTALCSKVINCIRSDLATSSYYQELTLPVPDAKEITQAYCQTPGDCGLRRLIVLMHIMLMRGGGKPMTEVQTRALIGETPVEFAQELAVKLLLHDNSRNSSAFWKEDKVVAWLQDD